LSRKAEILILQYCYVIADIFQA